MLNFVITDLIFYRSYNIIYITEIVGNYKWEEIKMSKKIISLLLSLMLVVSMVAVAAVSVSADVDDDGYYVPAEGVSTYRYYFYMPSDWYNDCANSAGIYWWTGSDTVPAWPGCLARTTEFSNVYYSDVPTDTGVIIWNNAFDGGDDSTAPDYAKAVQTVDIPMSFIMDGDTELYNSEFFAEMEASFNSDKAALGAYADNFYIDEDYGFAFNCNNMIYVIDPSMQNVETSGKIKDAGNWYFYYGNGEYGTYPTREAAMAKGVIYNTDYQPPKPNTATTPITSPSDTTVTDPAQAPDLTVNATSNYFPKATSVYNEETKEVTVTYWFKSSKEVLDLQWELTYDSDVLSYSSKNTLASICPVIGDTAIMNEIAPGLIKYNAVNLRLFDFTKEETPLVQMVFDVKDIADKAPVNTTVDLTMDVLRVSEIDPATFMTDASKEIILIDFYSVIENAQTATVTVDRRTSLTPSTFVAPTTAAPTTEPTTVVTEPTTIEPTTVPATTVEPEPTVPNLTVNATSNYFPKASAEYNKSTNEVVVKYWLQSNMNVLDLQWYLTYDSEILTLSDKNTPESICPAIGASAVYNTSIKNTIKYNASNLSLFDFSGEETTFAEIVFEVNDLTGVAPASTTIDLMVDVLRVSKVDPTTLRSDANEELIIVDNYEVSTDEKAVAAIVDKGTTLTPSTFVAPTTAAPTTEPTTAAPTTEVPTTEPTEPTTVAPTTAPATEPVTDPPATEPTTVEPTTEAPTTEPVEEGTTIAPAEGTTSADPTSATDSAATPDSSKPGTDSKPVQTGSASLAVVILTLLIAATGVMFVLRKKETY